MGLKTRVTVPEVEESKLAREKALEAERTIGENGAYAFRMGWSSAILYMLGKEMDALASNQEKGK